jgi:predicted aconitase with swiveling domain
MVKGRGEGPALVTTMPINFTAAMTKPANVLTKDLLCDRHHDLTGKKLRGTVVLFPACIGSTHTGLVLLEIAVRRVAPAAMIVRRADSLLVSGSILGEVWYGRGIPIVEYDGDDLYDAIEPGDVVAVDGATGEITVTPAGRPAARGR